MTRSALIGLPFDHESSHLRGAAEAPARVRHALWSESGNTFSERGVDISDPSVLRDVGDVVADEPSE